MHVQTIPKSPPKIIVQVAESCDFFFADFDDSEVSGKLHHKKFAKVSRFSQEYEQTFSLSYNKDISERNYYGERFYEATVYALA